MLFKSSLFMLPAVLGFALVVGPACSKKKSSSESSSSSSTSSSDVNDMANFKMASSISLVITSESEATSLVGGLRLAIDAKAFGPETEYKKDVTQAYVHDPAFEALDTVNSILCYIDQMGFADKGKADFVAGGEQYPFSTTYSAQIDKSPCESKGQQDSKGSSSGSSKSIQMVNLKVDRDGPTSPLHVVGWMDEQDEMGEQRIVFDLILAEPAVGDEASSGFGVFEMDFAGFEVIPGGGLEPRMRGILDTLKPDPNTLLVSFINEGDGFNAKASATLRLDAEENVESGVAATEVYMGGGPGGPPELLEGDDGQGGGPGGQEMKKGFKISFDKNFMKREVLDANGNTEAAVCLSTKKPELSAWRYGVYDAAGARLKIKGGFPITYDLNGRKEHGWAGYWGVHTPPHITLVTGQKVQKEVFGNAEKEDFELIVSPGRLIKHTPVKLESSDVQEAVWEYHSWEGAFRLSFDGTNWNKTYVMTMPTEQDIQAAEQAGKPWQETWTPTSGVFTFKDGDHHIFSESYHGARLKVTGANFEVFYAKDSVVSNSFEGTNLFCVNRCLRAGITSTQIAKGDSDETDNDGPFFQSRSKDTYELLLKGNPKQYTWDKDKMVLNLDGSPVILDASVTKISGQNSWGIHSGEMVTDKSHFDSEGRITEGNSWYSWETGPNSWNKFSALKKADGSKEQFEAPRRFKYRHLKANDITGKSGENSYLEKTFILEYAGHGELWGIPSANFGEDDDEQHYAPAFTIRSGTVIKEMDTDAEYVVKILEAEERLKKVADTDCAGLSSADVPPLPNIDGWENPADQDDGLIDEVDNAPAVIEGELQQ